MHSTSRLFSKTDTRATYCEKCAFVRPSVGFEDAYPAASEECEQLRDYEYKEEYPQPGNLFDVRYCCFMIFVAVNGCNKKMELVSYICTY